VKFLVRKDSFGCFHCSNFVQVHLMLDADSFNFGFTHIVILLTFLEISSLYHNFYQFLKRNSGEDSWAWYLFG